MWAPYFGRAHVYSELLDEARFDGHTFGDLGARRQRPRIFIHVSDMGTRSRFECNQRQFDLICSDLSQRPLSVATTSSSALPLILRPISIKSVVGRTDFTHRRGLRRRNGHRGADSGRTRGGHISMPRSAPRIHQLDGRLSDNIGMRSVLETSNPRSNCSGCTRSGTWST